MMMMMVLVQGIRDESLVPRDYVLEGGEGVGEVKALLVDCYTHLAHAYLRVGRLMTHTRGHRGLKEGPCDG